jgi:formate dehydrogenase iron-sulfur subunit
MDKPETYGLPSNPKLPSRSVLPSSLFSLGGAIVMGLAAVFSFRVRRVNQLNGGSAAPAETASDEEA